MVIAHPPEVIIAYNWSITASKGQSPRAARRGPEKYREWALWEKVVERGWKYLEFVCHNEAGTNCNCVWTMFHCSVNWCKNRDC